MEKEISVAKAENDRMRKTLDLLENELVKTFATIYIMLIWLPEEVTKLENNHCDHPNAMPIADSRAFLSEDFSKRCGTIESGMLDMRTSKGNRFIMFQELMIRSLGKMKGWIQ